MQNAQTVKYLAVTPPAAIVDNAAFTTASVDTLGWDYLTFLIHFGAMDIAMAALKVQTSDTDSAYADLSGADFSADGTLPSATADNTFCVVNINLVGKKRYFDLSATGGDGSAGTYMTVIAILSRGKQFPASATGQGAGQVLNVR